MTRARRPGVQRLPFREVDLARGRAAHAGSVKQQVLRSRAFNMSARRSDVGFHPPIVAWSARGKECDVHGAVGVGVFYVTAIGAVLARALACSDRDYIFG